MREKGAEREKEGGGGTEKRKEERGGAKEELIRNVEGKGMELKR